EGKFTVINPRTVSHGAQISHINPAPDSRHDLANFPLPTPNKGTTGWTGGPAGSHSGPSGNEGLQSPTPNSAHVVGTSVSPLVPAAKYASRTMGIVSFSCYSTKYAAAIAGTAAAAATASTANTIECQFGGNGSNTKHGMGCTKYWYSNECTSSIGPHGSGSTSGIRACVLKL
ncbi:hypothetical protein Tco_0293937, partial [Tanacetum coccineum]